MKPEPQTDRNRLADSEPMRVHYRLYCAPDEDPGRKAAAIALEQTVELPADLLPEGIAGKWTGQVTLLEPGDDDDWQCCIAYPAAAAGSELSQLLNTLFGNISLQDGIRIDAIDWPDSMLSAFGGPAYGLEGLRQRCRVDRGQPLTSTALKPLGLSAAELAARAAAFAEGGIDLIKDDHGLSDQAPAPFHERLQRCQEAVTRANLRVGGNSLYLPNVTAPPQQLAERMQAAVNAGCTAVLLSPWLSGLDSVRWARDAFGLAIMAHPALTGALFRRRHGFKPAVLLGDLFRIAGADAVIYPNVGGRFGFSLDTCQQINAALRRPLGELRAAAPTAGGGVRLSDAGSWLDRYGPDTIFLIGGSLYAEGDLRAAAGRLRRALGR